ncbi:hypothetical protein CAI21_05570 [Alkalilimnicola ehrlichii]|uniref:Uncharacterized protein n=1 Tax=Alkalilimnicola ehrlichii TaxID=351052 RepID=A0A3E0X1D8_9GAMM|nr:hypothetical protein [Alkalilimnicola ehrlichii]RFA30516.1 hypothetical protein CAI21_05570 [Alkalilimnicola ehrlichii]RFA38065.1 hypothetical protein CAL65_06940 [Alkalilimnicola ehrlichii]
MIRTFDDVLATSLRTRKPQRLLLLFVKAAPSAPLAQYDLAGAQLEPVLALNKVVSGSLRFPDLVEEADRQRRDWDFVLIAAVSKRDGGLPSSQEAHQHLQERAEQALASGDFSRFLVFDRQEQPLWPAPERQLH